MPRIGLQLTPFNALDEISQYSIGTTRQTDLLGLAHDQAVEEFDFRAPLIQAFYYFHAVTGPSGSRPLLPT